MIMAVKGKNITIECAAFATAGGGIRFTWTRDNFDVDPELIETQMQRNNESRTNVDDETDTAKIEDSENATRINITVATSRLHLRDVDAKTVGRYRCIAFNDFGKVYSKKSQVIVICRWRHRQHFSIRMSK